MWRGVKSAAPAWSPNHDGVQSDDMTNVFAVILIVPNFTDHQNRNEVYNRLKDLVSLSAYIRIKWEFSFGLCRVRNSSISVSHKYRGLVW
jgi:hypothetical protein